MNAENIDNQKPYRAEVSMDYLGIASLNSYVTCDTASRLEMMCGHIGSCLTIDQPDIPIISTLMENEYGKYTFSKKVKTNVTVLAVIDQYVRSATEDNINHNPLKLIVVECEETREIDYITVEEYHSLHQQFGFRYKKNEQAIYDAKFTKRIKAGTILADSPNIDANGNYRFGAQANVVFLSVPAVIEDGILLSESFAARCTTRCFSTHVVSWGGDEFPLNLYGDDNTDEYKITPDIGEYVREDGLLVALRKHDPIRAITEQTKWALKEIDPYFDRPTYVESGAKVININVLTDDKAKKTTPVGMDAQALKYVRAKRRYYQDIVDLYEELVKRRGKKLAISPKFHRLVYEAYLDIGDFGKKDRVTKMYRGVPLDDYRMEITIEYELVPTIGFKFTTKHGGKGVVCAVEKDEHMPLDALGNRADAVFDPIGCFKRTNIGGLHEHFNSACARDLTTRLRQKADILPNQQNETALREILPSKDYVDEFYNIVRDFRYTVSPREGEILDSEVFKKYIEDQENQRIVDINHKLGFTKTKEKPLNFKEVEVMKWLLLQPHLYVPTNNQKRNMQITRELREKYPPCYGPITYVTCEGDRETTVANVLIGSMQLMLLDKTGYNYAAVSSSKTNHLGIPSKLTNKERNSSPVRQAPIRICGETEGRIHANTMGGRATAGWIEQSNNPKIHRDICFSIMDADNPMNIDSIVDYSVHPRGRSRPVVQMTHILQCGGWLLTRGNNNEND